ncbi:MAG: ethylbenzene dehydrogenase-related protein [Bacteroidota bacterium]
MKKQVILLIVFILSAFVVFAQNVGQGEKTFKTICAACHTIGKGKIVGPDLSGVTQRRTEKWLLSFIKSSQTMVKNNDAAAVKVFNENSKIPMPDQNLTDVQIKDVLAYIKSLSPVQKKVPAKTSNVPAEQKLKVTKIENPANDWIEAAYKLTSYSSQRPVNPKMLHDSAWISIKPLKISLSPQNVTYPNLHQASVDSICIKSRYTEKEVAFLVEWRDSTRNTEVDADKFCDQFAVELPLDKNNIPSYMMGNAGGIVHIVHWKAVWQVDCEQGFQDVQIKYPNMWVDVYPGLESYLDRSKRLYAQDITAVHIVETHSYGNLPGTYSNNPLSQIKRKEPVEEASAEGFGTLATQETQQAKGWGEWKDGWWRICVVVPVNTGNIYKAVVKDKSKVAFAIWDGGFQNIGGRKHFVPWIDLHLKK